TLHLAPPRRVRIEGKDRHLAAKQLLQPLDKTASATAALLRRLPAIFAVHVKDQVDCPVLVNQSRQYQARQKGFTSTRLAKDPVPAFNKAFQIDTDRGLHIEGTTNMEIACAVLFAAEDTVHVFLLGLTHD